MTVAASETKSIPILSDSLFQQQLQLLFNPTVYLQRLLDLSSDVVSMPSAGFPRPVVLVHEPSALKQMLMDKKMFNAAGELNAIVEPLTGLNSLLSLSGDRHRGRRKLLMPSFHGERMYRYGKIIQGIIQEELSELKVGDPFIAQDLTQRITLRTIIDVVFGMRGGDRYEPLIRRMRDILNRFRSPVSTSFLFFPSLQKDLGPWSPWGSYVRARDRFDELIYAEISDRQANPDPDRTDILSLLIEARDEDGNGLTPQELRDELMLLLFAGHDTTAIALAWSMYWLHANPDILQKVRDEVLALGPDADPMDIYKLPYLTAVGNECLRINPVAMFTLSRQANEKTRLLDYEIEPDDILVGCIYTLHQRPDIYPNPRQFRPERFLERTFTPYEFMPFGGGARRCVGEALAQFELRLGIAAFATQGKFELLDKVPLKAKRRGLILAPATGVNMKFEGNLPK